MTFATNALPRRYGPGRCKRCGVEISWQKDDAGLLPIDSKGYHQCEYDKYENFLKGKGEVNDFAELDWFEMQNVTEVMQEAKRTRNPVQCSLKIALSCPGEDVQIIVRMEGTKGWPGKPWAKIRYARYDTKRATAALQLVGSKRVWNMDSDDTKAAVLYRPRVYEDGWLGQVIQRTKANTHGKRKRIG